MHKITLLKLLADVMTSVYQKTKIKVKPQKYHNPWLTKGIKKSSKRKQKLYENFLKSRNGKMRSHENLTKVFLNPLNANRKGIIIRVKY